MLVKVNPDYFGMYGFFKKETESVVIKTRESAPFEEDDALSLKMIEKGVLIEAGKVKETVSKPAEPVEVAKEAEPLPEINLGDMTLKELKELAKDCGVTFRIGMNKAALIEAIEKALDEEAEPVLKVQLPE